MRLAILSAGLAELLEKGPAVSLPEIARRAGVQKSSLYRRYPTRASLLVEIALTAAERAIAIDDTGSLATDLVRVLERARAFIDSPVGRALLALSASSEAQGERETIRAYWRARLDALDVVFARARARGEWPVRANPAPVIGLLVGSMWFQALTGQAPPSRAALRATVGLVLAGAGATPRRGRAT